MSKHRCTQGFATCLRLTEVVRRLSENSMGVKRPKVRVFMMKLWHFWAVNMLFAAEFSREFGSIDLITPCFHFEFC